MVNKKGIYIALSVLALALTGLGIAGYFDLRAKYKKLDEKFTATADTLANYKATLQNQGLYGPLKNTVDSLGEEFTQLRGFTEGFFGGSEQIHKELGDEIVDVQGRIGKLELKTNNLKK